MAVSVATVGVTNVVAAIPPELRAEPALNPYQPNHSRPAPSITNGKLCGRIGEVGQPLRRPSTRHNARPAAPELIWTAVSPAKSIALSLLAIQPPVSAVNPSNAKTPCATGEETNVAHKPAKTNQEPNLSRSATAPETSATVMIANINWNITNTSCGIVPASGMLTASAASPPADGSATTAAEALPAMRPLRPKYCAGLPNRLPTSLPNAIE